MFLGESQGNFCQKVHRNRGIVFLMGLPILAPFTPKQLEKDDFMPLVLHVKTTPRFSQSSTYTICNLR